MGPSELGRRGQSCVADTNGGLSQDGPRLASHAARVIRQLELIGTIGRPANQDEPPIAVTAIDVPVLIDGEKDARMLGPGAIPVLGCAVTHHSVAADPNDFRRGDHADPSSGARNSRPDDAVRTTASS
jgi:hypothetical protein